VAFGFQVLGGIGALIFCILVSGSCFGALNATTFTSSRLYFAAAKEGYLPAIIGTLGLSGFGGSAGMNMPSLQSRIPTSPSSRRAQRKQLFNTPIPSLLLNFTLTTIYIILGSFGSLVSFYGVAGYSFYFTTVLGLLVLRVREPNLERPYKCWIVTPIVFCCVSLFLLSRSVVAQPWSIVTVLGFLIAGTVVFYWRVRPEKRKDLGTMGALASGNGTGIGRAARESPAWMFWKRWSR
jgi:amino acid transporter